MKKNETNLFAQAKNCQLCADILPNPPRPIVQLGEKTRILIIGQAPGLKAHDSSLAWNDASGERLRSWLSINKDTFYNPKQIAILPMSFCYPGKGKQGDLPPIKACAPLWHSRLIKLMSIKHIILVGKYAQDYYLQDNVTLTERLQQWQVYLPNYLLLPHPSPRNNIWLKKNPWFERDALPFIRQKIQHALQDL